MDDDAIPSEPLFRASKRRKVFRKRGDSNGSDEGTQCAVPIVPEAEAEPNLGQDDGDSASGISRSQRKGGARKYGIRFSSTNDQRNIEQVLEEETVLVPVNEDGAMEILANDRFVKPTGRVDVTEDKNMMAYVDSKLAEMRSSAASPSDDGNAPVANTISGNREQEDPANYGAQRHTDVANPLDKPSAPTAHHHRTFQQAQSRSTRTYQRPTKRRQAPPRDETDVARDSMIDQIMRENQVPVYDRTASHTQAPRATDDDSMDNDTAAAEAFKAELLADMARNTRRRPPASASASSTAKGAGSMQTGPKLGGSRAQREKMRAIEEAKVREGRK